MKNQIIDSLDLTWIQSFLIDCYECIWVYLNVCKCMWVYLSVMKVFDCLWMLWVYLSIFECIWVYVSVCECMWVYLSAYTDTLKNNHNNHIHSHTLMTIKKIPYSHINSRHSHKLMCTEMYLCAFLCFPYTP